MFDCTVYILENNLKINYREFEHLTRLCVGLQFILFFEANPGEGLTLRFIDQNPSSIV